MIDLAGDSAFGFDGMETETVCRYHLPVIVVVCNNGGIYNGKDPEIDGMVSPTYLDPSGQYDLLSRAFGGRAYCVRTYQEMEDALKEAYASKEPTVINAVLDPNMGKESGHIGHLNPVIFHEDGPVDLPSEK